MPPSTSLVAAGALPSAMDACVSQDVPISSARFNAVYDAHVDFVWRNARRLGVEDAALDDVVQSVFLVVFRRLDGFEGRSSLKTWVYEILIHVVRDHRRSRSRKSPACRNPEGVDPAMLSAPVDQRPDRLADQADAARRVRELLDQLDEDKREVFTMAELEGLTQREIAEILHEPAGTVASRLRAARADFERAALRARSREHRRQR